MPIQQLPPKHCFDLREADPSIVHLDVRSPEEFAAGHPAGALNVPIFFRGPGGMTPNEEFLAVARRLTATDKRVVLSCAMGGRSQRAAELLEGAGYAQLVNMVGGYAGKRQPDGTVIERGWAEIGLPTEQDAGERAWERLRQQS